MKWVCFLLLVTNFSFDVLSTIFSKMPVATGTIVSSTHRDDRHIATLATKEGKLSESQFFRAGEFTGIVWKVTPGASADTAVVEITSDVARLPLQREFNTYSTLKYANILLVIELTLIFLIFRIIFSRRRLLSRIAVAAILLSVVTWVFKNIVLDQIHQYGGVYNAGTSILVIVFALVYYYTELNNPENLFVYSTPSFWIVCAILLYQAGTFFLFLYANSLNQNELSNFYMFDSIFYILQNILFAIAFLKPSKNLPPLNRI